MDGHCAATLSWLPAPAPSRTVPPLAHTTSPHTSAPAHKSPQNQLCPLPGVSPRQLCPGQATCHAGRGRPAVVSGGTTVAVAAQAPPRACHPPVSPAGPGRAVPGVTRSAVQHYHGPSFFLLSSPSRARGGSRPVPAAAVARTPASVLTCRPRPRSRNPRSLPATLTGRPGGAHG